MNKTKKIKPTDPEPPKSARYGDRTPAWAAWLQRTNPTDYAQRFAECPVDFSVKD